MTVRITEDDFDIKAEHEALKSPDAGAIVTFTGTVRDLPDGGLNAMTLEHYPGMTESEIEIIINEAKARWSLKKVTVIHRVGRLLPKENIVFDPKPSKNSGTHIHTPFPEGFFFRGKKRSRPTRVSRLGCLLMGRLGLALVACLGLASLAPAHLA